MEYMIIILAILLGILVIVNYFVFNKKVLSPAVIYCIGFFISSCWAALYSERWRLRLTTETFAVLLGGAFLFSVSSLLIHKIYATVLPQKKEDSIFLLPKSYKTIIIIIFQVLTIIYNIYYITKITNKSFFDFIAASRIIDNYKFSDKVFYYPEPLALFILTNKMIGYVACYYIANEIVHNKKIPYTFIIVFILACFSSVLSGARTGLIFYLISLFYCFADAYEKKENKSILSNLKILTSIGIVAILFVLGFRYIGVLMHRTINQNMMDYLATYLGASIVNLNAYLLSPWKRNFLWGSQTFIILLRTVAPKFGFPEYANYQLDLPFRKYKTYNLGNVYTTYYPFHYDFGYLGIIILTLLMGIISQIIYEMSREKRFNIEKYFVFGYSQVIPAIFFSFFSNKFYETVPTWAYAKGFLIGSMIMFMLSMKDFSLFSGILQKAKKDKG